MRSARDDFPQAAAAERHPATSAVMRAELGTMFAELDRCRAWLNQLPHHVAEQLLDTNPPDLP